MVDTLAIFNDLRKSLGDEAASKMAQIIQGLYEELSQAVTKEDFDELKAVVKDLAEAQRKTEERLDRLAERVEELAQAQARTDSRLEELAEAQTRTENRLEKLIFEHKKTREQLGDLSHTVGYRLEDEAIWALPALLKKDFGIEVDGELERGYVELSPGRYFEVNIWGYASKNGEDLAILGEAKTQLKKKDVADFLKRVSRLQGVTEKKIFPVLITYQTSPKVREFAQKEGIKIYFSFELKPTRS